MFRDTLRYTAVKVEIHVTVNTSGGGPASAKATSSPSPPLTPSSAGAHSPVTTPPGSQMASLSLPPLASHQTSSLSPQPATGCTLQKTLSDLKKHRTDLRASFNRSSYSTALENGAYPSVSPTTTGQLYVVNARPDNAVAMRSPTTFKS